MTGSAPPEFLTRWPVIPVVTLTDAQLAVPLARALLSGGIGVIEVTLRHAEGLRSIAIIAREVPEMQIGAGTALSGADLRAAAQAGATFAVSPGSTGSLLSEARTLGLPYLPAVATPSELMTGLEAGYRYFKFFPATAAGGIEMLRALQQPFPQARFCATGGISAANAPEYLRLANVLCVGGSWLVSAEALARRDWGRVSSLAAEAAALRRPT